MAQEVLSTIAPGAIGYAEKTVVEKLLNAKTYPISPKEMIGFKVPDDSVVAGNPARIIRSASRSSVDS